MQQLRYVCAAAALVSIAAQQYACGTCANGGPPPMAANQLMLACSGSTTISAIQFASYGTPTGSCGSWQVGSCNAANSTTIVSSTCVGQQNCTIFPNTTTFGDPCFGTAKELAVQFVCSGAGAGSAQCSDGPAPSPQNVTVTVQPSVVMKTLFAVPSLQVVSQHLLMRDSPIHDPSWAALAALPTPQHARMVPWIPYAKVGVAELDPPSPAEYVCGPMSWIGGQTQPVTLDCGAGATISGVDFASYGTAAGVCGGYSINSACHASNSSAVLSALCVGKQSCVVDFGAAPFGAPPCTGAYLAAQLSCDGATGVHTHWNFTLLDDLMLDFWSNVDGNASAPIPNFSTAPNWLYNSQSWVYADDAASPWYGYETGAAPASNATALGDYYGRVLSWYTRGGFTDEAGAWHGGGHYLNITMYEVFNEVDYEHGHTPQSYTADFDAVVAGIRRWADPDGRIAFVGLSLPNIDDTPTVVAFASYFLNASNHAPGARNALQAIGYHAYPTNGGYSPDPSTFTRMFDYVDDFVTKVEAVDAAIAAASPATLVALDESGVDMDAVLSRGPPPGNGPRFWVAAGGYFAYLFSSASVVSERVFVVGQSQWMDAPGQEPSVTMLDWSTGNGTAKYWVLHMLLQAHARGDTYVNTTCTQRSVMHAQAVLPTAGAGAGGAPRQWRMALLLVNKINAPVSATLVSGLQPPPAACNATVVDETTGLGPPYTVACTDGGVLPLAPYATAVVYWW